MKKLMLLFLLVRCPFIFAYAKWVDLDRLAPTQMNIGLIAMKDKVQKIEKKDREGELLKYLNKKIAPAFIGPDGRYYIIDRHHTSRALYEAKVSFKRFKVDIIKDLSHLSWDEFFGFMQKRQFLYLYDQGVGPLSPNTLPKYIWDLSDDPFRSLSWMVRERGGFKKVDIPYLEFIWGDFFRKRIHLNGHEQCDLDRVFKEAFELSQSDEASFLPGYSTKKQHKISTSVVIDQLDPIEWGGPERFEDHE